jgi:hypothetical protein
VSEPRTTAALVFMAAITIVLSIGIVVSAWLP